MSLLVNWLYFCPIKMVNSGDLPLEEILLPQVVSNLLEGLKEHGHPLIARIGMQYEVHGTIALPTA